MDDLLRLETRQELSLARDIRGDRGIHDGEPLVRQLDDDAASIDRVSQASDETAPLEPVDPAGDAR